MQRAEMVRAGAKQLVAAENAIDLALCEVATLANDLGRMRLGSNMSAVVGQDVIDGVADLYVKLAGARRGVVTLHNDLSDVKVQIGCATISTGTNHDKPDGAGVIGLKAVSTAGRAA